MMTSAKGTTTATSDDLIFAALATRLPQQGVIIPPAADAKPSPLPLPLPARAIAAEHGLSPLFDAAVSGVRSRFKHLSPEDIASPPHQWFDAALARQIAIHIMTAEFHVPKRAIAGDILRSREAVNRALRTVNERMSPPDFARAYAAMREAARTAACRKMKLSTPDRSDAR